MKALEEVRALVAAVGPQIPDIEGILERGEGEWLLRLPDLDVSLEFDATAERLMLSAQLDEPRAEARSEVHATLLQYALLWRDTGGVFTALTAQGAPVVLLALSGDEIAGETLATVLPNFVEKARALQTYVSRGGEAQAPRFTTHETVLRA